MFRTLSCVSFKTFIRRDKLKYKRCEIAQMSASRPGILPMAVIRHLHRDKRASTIFKCARAKWLYSLGTGTPATFRSQLLAMENKVFIHFDLSI